jgi:hypothetical protein
VRALRPGVRLLSTLPDGEVVTTAYIFGCQRWETQCGEHGAVWHYSASEAEAYHRGYVYGEGVDVQIIDDHAASDDDAIADRLAQLAARLYALASQPRCTEAELADVAGGLADLRTVLSLRGAE